MLFNFLLSDSKLSGTLLESIKVFLPSPPNLGRGMEILKNPCLVNPLHNAGQGFDGETEDYTKELKNELMQASEPEPISEIKIIAHAHGT